jgi:hypothetical protein
VVLYSEVSLKSAGDTASATCLDQTDGLVACSDIQFCFNTLQLMKFYRRTKFDDNIGQYFCIKCIVNFPEVFRTSIDLYSQGKFCPR